MFGAASELMKLELTVMYDIWCRLENKIWDSLLTIQLIRCFILQHSEAYHNFVKCLWSVILFNT